MRVVVAMSGGVDSSVAAGLLVEAGHEVIGLSMKTHAEAPKHNRACCTPDDMRDARRVADFLKIPFYLLDYTELFEAAVVRPFAEAYRTGRTPNPCIECNDKVKFPALWGRAKLLGAERLATGHYARIGEHGGRVALLRGVDRRKDQSYFLYRLGSDLLANVLFPVGAMTKDEVRAAARRLGLPVADKVESQEICFVGADGYAATVERLAGEGGRAGAIVDGEGRTLGAHEGVHHFTLGQRRGLKIAAPTPLYVTSIDANAGVVQVGEREALLTQEIEIENVAGDPPNGPVEVQQRYREPPRPAELARLAGGRARLSFRNPEMRGAPGQAAVFYQGDILLGGGTIAASMQSQPASVAGA